MTLPLWKVRRSAMLSQISMPTTVPLDSTLLPLMTVRKTCSYLTPDDGVWPGINTDQGSQFTSDEFTRVLKANDIKISMDGKGRWVDNVFVERLWKSVKYEHVYLHAYESVDEAKRKLTSYFTFYNSARPHSSLGGVTPDTAYFGRLQTHRAA